MAEDRSTDYFAACGCVQFSQAHTKGINEADLEGDLQFQECSMPGEMLPIGPCAVGIHSDGARPWCVPRPLGYRARWQITSP